jgi:hypothetical protein
VTFAALLCTLVARNAALFRTRLYEQGDSGANSILIEQAMRFRLLVGHYSREGFNHPGPAFLYVQAFGEWLARDLLHVVPTAWNGQLLAVYALDSALAALVVVVVYGWTGSMRCAAAAFAVILIFAAMHPGIVTSNWMPFMLILPFFVFLLAAASVAAGQARDLWVLALSGWLLIHGYAPSLLLVPVLMVAVAVLALLPFRGDRLAEAPARARASIREHRASWIAAAAISAVFILPIALNLILHWPGEFGKYLTYGRSHKAGGHTAPQVVKYVLWYWWPHSSASGLVVLALLFTASSGVAVLLARGPLRRWLGCLVAMAAAATLTFCVYTAVGIDALTPYIGYFYWSVPFVLLLVIAVGLAAAAPLPRAVPGTVAVAAAAGALIVFAFAANLGTDLHDNNPGLPGAVSALAARSPGRPIVIVPQGVARVATTGFLVQAERTGVRACVNQRHWTYEITTQFVCTTRELSEGVRYRFVSSDPPGATIILRFGTPSPSYATVIGG